MKTVDDDIENKYAARPVYLRVLLYTAGEVADVFRTDWFVESLLTESLIPFVIRTCKLFCKSRPGRFLMWSAFGVVLLALILPFASIGAVFGFVLLTAPLLAAIPVITGLYVVPTELAKRVVFHYAAISRGWGVGE